jgi:hypothetical protein
MEGRLYHKALLLCPPQYSLYYAIKSILSEICHEVMGMNVLNYTKKYEVNINTQMFRLPFSIRNKWTSYYQGKINALFLLDFKKLSPDMVFVYNNEMLLPATVSEIKKTAKIVFFLGDSPFFTPTNDYFLTLLNMGNMVLAPDSFWVQHLQTMGIRNSFYFVPGIDETSYHENHDKAFMQNIHNTEILYCGMSYVNSWGYKKAMLMSKFTDFKFEIYGDRRWKKWFPFFPELETVFHESGFIPTPLLNAMFNKTKIMPVDGNPGILNGVHLRLFEALGAGVLPLIEFREDVEKTVFAGLDIEIPIIRTYNKATELAERYLSDESLRLTTVSAMKQHVLSKYSPGKNAARILEFLRDSEK